MHNQQASEQEAAVLRETAARVVASELVKNIIARHGDKDREYLLAFGESLLVNIIKDPVACEVMDEATRGLNPRQAFRFMRQIMRGELLKKIDAESASPRHHVARAQA